MAARIPARLTAAEGRRFGLTVGGAFLLLSTVAWYREHATVMVALVCLGAALVLAGLVVPTRLGVVERSWMRLAHAISRVTVPVGMAVIYFGTITPVGFLRRAVGGDPLRHGEQEGTFWKSRRGRSTTSMERQF